MDPILLRLWKKSLVQATPEWVLPTVSNHEAILYWGKAAQASFQARPPKSGLPYYVVQGEHPLPGERSFQAGAEILDFFDALKRMKIPKLRVFLSGGASSMAWLKPASTSEKKLHMILSQAYLSSVTIQQLNQLRSQYCELKSGGAARWLNKIAPDVRVHVDVISDVLPFGPGVVGSGPFWDGKTTHRVVMDNGRWMKIIKNLAQAEGVPVFNFSYGNFGDVQDWLKKISLQIKENLKKRGLLIFGGEPRLDLLKKHGRGGRQSHLAALLLKQWWNEIEDGKTEILCASSDGVDGTSRGAGAILTNRMAEVCSKAQLDQAIRGYRTGAYFEQKKMLLPTQRTGTNVQDVVLVQLNFDHIR